MGERTEKNRRMRRTSPRRKAEQHVQPLVGNLYPREEKRYKHPGSKYRLTNDGWVPIYTAEEAEDLGLSTIAEMAEIFEMSKEMLYARINACRNRHGSPKIAGVMFPRPMMGGQPRHVYSLHGVEIALQNYQHRKPGRPKKEES